MKPSSWYFRSSSGPVSFSARPRNDHCCRGGKSGLSKAGHMMVHPRWCWFALLVALSLVTEGARAQQVFVIEKMGFEVSKSKLRVASCAPTYPPFVMTGSDGKLTGLEVTLFKRIYSIMVTQVTEINATDIMDLIGTEPPEISAIKGYPDDAVKVLRNGTFDIYFCGAYMTVDRGEFLDFSPPTIVSGYTMLVSSKPAEATWEEVRLKAFGKPNALAIYTVIVLIFMNLAYSHLLWVLERRHNGTIRSVYGPGVYDAFWLGIITATTIGFGDKTPRTLSGRVVTVAWMITGTYLIGLFMASITSGFITAKLDEVKMQAPLTEASDLVGLSDRRVGAAFPKAAQALREEAPGVVVQSFYDPMQAYRALARGQIDVLIDDAVMAVYNMNSVAEFRDKFTMQGNQFGGVDYGYLLSMPGGQSHPVHPHFYRAVLEYLNGKTRLEAAALIQSWFGSTKIIVPQTYAQDAAWKLSEINKQMAWTLFGWTLFWFIVSCLSAPRKTPEEEVYHAFLKALRLSTYEFNRHVVRRAAEELFSKIDVDKTATVDISDIIATLRMLSNSQSVQMTALIVQEIKRVVGRDVAQAPSGGANQRPAVPHQGLGFRQQSSLSNKPLVEMALAAGSQLSQLASKGSRIKQYASKTPARTQTGLFPWFQSSARSSLGPDGGEEADFYDLEMTLTREEFVQVCIHIVLECGSNKSQADVTPATQHHILHVHDEIRRQLDVMDYKARMIEWRLRDEEEQHLQPPDIPAGTPKDAVKRTSMVSSQEARRKTMEDRWKQNLGIEELQPAPVDMGAGVVLPQRQRVPQGSPGEASFRPVGPSVKSQTRDGQGIEVRLPGPAGTVFEGAGTGGTC